MRKNLIALVGAGLLLTGCAATAAPVPQTPVATTAAAADFCEVLESNEVEYRELMNGDQIRASQLADYSEWATSLEDSAPIDVSDDLDAYITPIRAAETATEDQSIDALEWTQASNRLNQHCIISG